MSSPACPPFARFLAQSAASGATPDQIAEVLSTTWQGIEAALAPVIGARGVAALYQRSVHLASAQHRPLSELQAAGGLDDMNLGALRAVLARQDAPQAAATGGALLESFHGLVVSLIGAALSGQLLGGVWTSFFGGTPAQEPPP